MKVVVCVSNVKTIILDKGEETDVESVREYLDETCSD